jgi:lipooligosaccharide transport system permease protein
MATPAARVLEHRILQYRRTWRGSIISSFVSPVLFLGAMGIGLGAYVDQSTAGAGALDGVPYLAFLAPGLLAAGAMQSAAAEATFPVLAAIQWVRQYPAMLATPIQIGDITLGQIAFFLLRLVMVSTIFAAVVVLLGAAVSVGILLAIPAAVLTGLAFATPIAAFSATRHNGAEFSLLFRFVITPMFLFSGTFFPIDQLPPAAQAVAFATPLYHGVALTRGLALADITPLEVLVHAGYLISLTVLGAILFDAALRRRLAT